MGRKSRSKKLWPPELRHPERCEEKELTWHDGHVTIPEPTSRTKWLFAPALITAVFLAYQPAWHGGFIWDDDTHLLKNPVLKSGGLARAWVPGSYINYWPLTFTIYRLEYETWGLNPLGFHLVNIALHAVAAMLLWRVLVELNVPGAMLAATIFALHPVNVESVAWITQLKGLLSLPFALVSVVLYLQYDRRGGWWRYAAAIVAFFLSTLAKGMVITLPVVLLACVWWRRGSIERRDLVRILPYALIGALMTGIEIWEQRLARAGDVVRTDGMLSRAAVAGCAVWFYLGKLLWPLNLCFFYPRWKIDDGDVISYLPGLLLLLTLFALALWRRRTWGRPVVMLIVCYVALLLPALGFVNIYYMRYSLVADHWQYAATIVPCAVLTGIAAAWTFRRPGRRLFAYVFSLSLLVILTVLTWRQSRMYADVETLYKTTIELNPNCWMAHSNLGDALADRGQVDDAMAHYEKALEINPDCVEAHTNLGAALAGRGQVDKAIDHYRKALQISPDYFGAHNNFGKALSNRGQVDEAIDHFRQAVKIKPDYYEAYNNLGAALARLGKVDEAIAQYRKALEIEPEYVEAHNNLGTALISLGKVDEAIVQYRKALKIDPDSAETQNNLGTALARLEQAEAAIGCFRKALELKSDFADAHNNLGLALTGRGQVDDAIIHYRKALEIKPDYLEAHYNLGSALAGRGQVAEALEHYQKALDLALARDDKVRANDIRDRINKLR